MLTGLAGLWTRRGRNGPVGGKSASRRRARADASSERARAPRSSWAKWTYVSGKLHTVACDGQAGADEARDGHGDLSRRATVPNGARRQRRNGLRHSLHRGGQRRYPHAADTCVPGDLAIESLVYTLKNGGLREQSRGDAPIDGQLCDFSDDAGADSRLTTPLARPTPQRPTSRPPRPRGARRPFLRSPSGARERQRLTIGADTG